jgi:hypothetical protein
MKNILLLTNFSETSRKAITNYLKACTKEQKQNYNFVLLNTYKRIKTGQSQLVKFVDVLGDYSKQDLQKEVRMIHEQPELKSVKIEMHSEFGDLVDVVERIGKEKGIDLIIMGTKGSNLLKELLLASDTDRLIRLSKEPVLVIPESIDFQKPKKVVFATHLEKCKNIKEFRKLIGIIKDFDVELLILNIYPDKKPDASEFENKLKPELAGTRHTFFYVRNPDIADGITGFVKMNKAHLLAIIDHKVNMLSELFRHSVQYKLTHSAEMPLLIIHE